ncbi:class I SAM-dependent methyltransferase [Pseudoxanthomonas sp. UTMC 1351]|uniref:class I SAM-dependent methyltransferase n=1 Tax=Pseudoxanthomonas sp. UTMC 1351 TaxID=2695853 RepID=UPI0034CE5476
MQKEELKAIFDKQAPGYDRQWARMAPIRDGLHFLLESVFADFPKDARILCVGVGTGAEMAYLANKFPHWRFTAVDPSGAMLDVCRQRAEAEGYLSRCDFHEGYLESLSTEDPHDGATCFLVSQFIVAQEARSEFFRAIASRLKPGGILASSDLASDIESDGYEALLRVWLNTMTPGIQPEALERTRTAYATDVAVLPPTIVASIIESAGFEPPVQFFQTGLIHAWFSRRI